MRCKTNAQGFVFLSSGFLAHSVVIFYVGGDTEMMKHVILWSSELLAPFIKLLYKINIAYEDSNFPYKQYEK